MDKVPFPKSIIIALFFLAVLFFGIIFTAYYSIKHPEFISVPTLWFKNKTNQKIDVTAHFFYLKTLEDPDKDKDGLEDKIAEKIIYKTDPKKSSSRKKGVLDGEYIYSLYQNTDSQSELDQYNKNFLDHISSIGATEATFPYTISLEDFFNYRASQTYNFYVGLPENLIKIVEESYQLRKTGEFIKSLELLENITGAEKNYPIIQYHLGLTYHGMKEYDKALSIYEKLIGSPDLRSPLLYSDISSIYYIKKDSQRTIEYLNRSIKEFPEDLKQYLKLATYYEEQRDFKKAEDVLISGLIVEPRYASFYNQLGILAAKQNNKEKEMELYKKAVFYDFRYSSGHLNLSLLFDLKDPKKALIEARIALDLDPKNPRYMIRAASLYRRLGEEDKGRTLEEEVKKIPDLDGKTLNDLGLIYYDRGEYTLAETYFRKAIVAEPTLPNPYNNLGNVLSLTNRGTEALQNYKKAVELDPNYVNATNNIGYLYLREGEYDKAITYYKKALALDKNHYIANVNLGDAYMLINDPSSARIYYEKALSLNIASIEEKKKIKEILESIKN